MPLNIIFAGTPELAVPTLEALIHSEHRVIAVYTQPDRPAGRGRHLTASPVKAIALQHNIPVYQPVSLRNPEAQKIFIDQQPDLLVVLGYGLILPKAILEAPRLGCVNVHVSLLPRWRGAAPIQRAIQAGDTKTGVTIMQMDAGLDTGKMLQKSMIPMDANATAAEVTTALGFLGAQTLLAALPNLETLQANAIVQNEAEATYAHKLSKEESSIDWKLSAAAIHNQIRAFNPWPVATAQYQGETLRIWKSEISAEKTSVPPGYLVSIGSDRLNVSTDDGVISILEVQRAGGKRVSAKDFINAERAGLKLQHPLFN